ncbi:MAG: hypothetical protein AAGJ97_08420 [Planctomycetota bacterium]
MHPTTAPVAPIPQVGRVETPRVFTFDSVLVTGVAFLAITAGYAVVVAPALFPTLLLLDLWLLGYHHVISTFTRLTFDAESRRKNRFLIYYLPPLVVAGVGAMVYGLGAWSVVSLYFYWQWLHYTRQSYGIFRILSKKSGIEAGAAHDRAAITALYAVPLFGVLWRSRQNPDTFLGLECWFMPVSEVVLAVAGAFAAVSMLWWVWETFRAREDGRWNPTVTIYLLTHHTIFYIGYYAITDINFGWLAINVWHNAQYIMIVWAFNQRRFKGGVDPKAWLLSWLSQPRTGRAIGYFALCLTISTGFYAATAWTLESSFLAAVPAASVLLYQTINFHHYITDTVIWRRPKQAAPAAKA